MAVCGAYAIRPYTGTPKNGDSFIPPYTGGLKNDDFSVRSASDVAVCRAYAIRPYPTGQKFIGVLVRF